MHAIAQLKMASLRTIIVARWAAWAGLGIVLTLTLVPPGLRPQSAVPRIYEHLAVFLLVGLAFGIGYFRYRLAIALAVVPVTAALEMFQLLVPGRHARLIDFVVNVAGAWLGLALAHAIGRVRQLT